MRRQMARACEQTMYQSNQGGSMQPGYYQQPQPIFRPQAYTPYPQPLQQPALSGRPVSSREEAQAIPMDYAAGAMYMPDLPHGVIYAKIVNTATGEAPLMMFRLAQEEPKKETPAYATLADVEALQGEIGRLREEMQRMRTQRRTKGEDEE